MGPNDKNSIKTWLKKFVKLMDHTYACNGLTNFEYEANAMTGIKNYVNLLKLEKNHITIKNDLQPMNALFLQAIIFHSFLYLYNFHVRWLLFAVKHRYLAFQGEIKHLKK